MGWIVLAISVLIMIGILVYFYKRYEAYQFDDEASMKKDASALIAFGVVFLVAGVVAWMALIAALSPPSDKRTARAATPSPAKSAYSAPAQTRDITPEDEPAPVAASEEARPSRPRTIVTVDETITEPASAFSQVEAVPVYFPVDSTMLVCEARVQLKAVADFLAQNDVSEIRLTGHTDTTGETARNQKLSQARVEKVRRHLVSVLGITQTRIQVGWQKDWQPAQVTEDSSGEKFNRRVIIEVEYIPVPNQLSDPIPSAWFDHLRKNCPDSLGFGPLKK